MQFWPIPCFRRLRHCVIDSFVITWEISNHYSLDTMYKFCIFVSDVYFHENPVCFADSKAHRFAVNKASTNSADAGFHIVQSTFLRPRAYVRQIWGHNQEVLHWRQRGTRREVYQDFGTKLGKKIWVTLFFCPISFTQIN